MSRFSDHKRLVHSPIGSYCVDCRKTWDTDDTEPPCGSPGLTTVRRCNEVAIIGFLAAKLACYEPDGVAISQALEYLKNVRQ